MDPEIKILFEQIAIADKHGDTSLVKQLQGLLGTVLGKTTPVAQPSAAGKRAVATRKRTTELSTFPAAPAANMAEKDELALVMQLSEQSAKEDELRRKGAYLETAVPQGTAESTGYYPGHEAAGSTPWGSNPDLFNTVTMTQGLDGMPSVSLNGAPPLPPTLPPGSAPVALPPGSAPFIPPMGSAVPPSVPVPPMGSALPAAPAASPLPAFNIKEFLDIGITVTTLPTQADYIAFMNKSPGKLPFDFYLDWIQTHMK